MKRLAFFKWAALATVAALTTALVYRGPQTALLVAILILLEAAISMAGMIAFLVVHGLSRLFSERHRGKAEGAAGVSALVYLEFLDASFSLDGVLGAFAISNDIVVIALGLGAGAIYVRSPTVYLVRRNALCEFRYLKHGAHWAIAVLGAVLLVRVVTTVPEWLTGVLGLGFIASAFVSSLLARHRHQAGREESTPREGTPSPAG